MKKNFVIVLLFGPNGVGKGTQASLVCKRYNLRHITTGDILVEFCKKTGLAGEAIQYQKIAKEAMESGSLVPSHIIYWLIESVIADALSGSFAGVLFDGFPRNTEQAEWLRDYLEREKLFINLVVELQADDETCVSRALNRAKKALGQGETPRSDDKEDVVRSRLAKYSKEVASAMNLLIGMTGAFFAIDGIRSVEAIHQDIQRFVCLLMNQKVNQPRSAKKK